MAEFEIKLGGKVDLLTKKELGDVLQAWRVEQVRGFVPRSFGATGGAIDSTFKLTLGGAAAPGSGQLAPNPGFVWSVKRIAVRLGGNPNIAWSVYRNAEGDNNVIRDVPATTFGYASFGLNELVLKESETLCLVVSGAPANSQLVVSGMAVELPSTLMWKLLG